MERMQKIDAKERLIVALDVAALKDAKKIVEKLGDSVGFYKVGMTLHTAAGLSIVKWLIKKKKKVFLDLKYFDVPNTIRGAVKNIAEIGAIFLTVHGNREIIKAAVEAKGKSKLKILTVTVLTNLDSYDIRDLGFKCSVSKLVLHRAKIALDAGCEGVVASGQEVKLIRDNIGGQLLIVTPGIRPEGTTVDDHKRAVTPTMAIKNGADYLVAGRPIIKTKNPKKAAEKIIKEMESAFLSREKKSPKKR